MITFHEVRKAAREIVNANPDKVNPRDRYGSCLYRGPDGDTCLGGAVLLHFGAELPREHHAIGDTPDAGMFTASAMDWLDELQTAADTYLTMATWSKALSEANKTWAREHRS